MLFSLITTAFASAAMAARPFLNEPDTGIEESLGNLAAGTLPDLSDVVALNDFDYVARNYLPVANYTYYRNGAGGEWSYRNNLEVYNRYRFKPSVMTDVTDIQSSLPTTILGYNFSSPFFISPCARADYAHSKAEINLVKGAATGNILYIVSAHQFLICESVFVNVSIKPSGYSSVPIETIAENAAEGQVLFAQLYLNNNDTQAQSMLTSAEEAGYKAIVWSIDSPGGASRQRAARFDVGSANSMFTRYTWDDYDKFRGMTELPIILKGIQKAADAKAAIKHQVPAIILSNHGGRNLDGSPSALEVAIELYKEDPTIFQQIEVYADGGVRYGSDAVRLLALGVQAVGLGRPFMYANAFGQEGVEKVIDIMNTEIAGDAANLGVADLKNISADLVDWEPNHWFS
ncbi:hypothetical protein ACKAV7_011961 [Fusarium commune]